MPIATAIDEKVSLQHDKKVTTTDPKSHTTTTTITHEEAQATSHVNVHSIQRRLTPPEMDPNTAKVLWRDLLFIILGAVALSIIGFVESHASEVEARTLSVQVAGYFAGFDMPANPNGIVDTGFMLTHPLYEFLKDNRNWNDSLAALNSIALLIPTLYVANLVVWVGDYSAVFRILALELLRAFCGWFTYLPPDPTYLNSYYDFPDVIHCLFQDCTGLVPEQMPFVSFFSGHVACLVVAGNHMWLSGHTRSATLLHVLNVLQIVRLLATRGHYSIDIIIGWYVAVYVTNPAGRLGRFYSRGATMEEMLPTTPQEAFETVTGVSDTRREKRMSLLLQRPEVQEALKAIEQEEANTSNLSSDTTARILQETASKMLQEQAQVFQDQMRLLQEQARQAGIHVTLPVLVPPGGGTVPVVKEPTTKEDAKEKKSQ